MENTKLTPEEVAKLQEIQQKNAAIVSELGNLEITKLQMESRRANAIEFLNSLREYRFNKCYRTCIIF